MTDNVPADAPSWADHIIAENDAAQLQHGLEAGQAEVRHVEAEHVVGAVTGMGAPHTGDALLDGFTLGNAVLAAQHAAGQDDPSAHAQDVPAVEYHEGVGHDPSADYQ